MLVTVSRHSQILKLPPKDGQINKFKLKCPLGVKNDEVLPDVCNSLLLSMRLMSFTWLAVILAMMAGLDIMIKDCITSNIMPRSCLWWT